MGSEFDALVEQFEQYQSKLRNIDEMLPDVNELRSQLTELSATASSPDGTVTVTTGPGGAVTGLTLKPEAMRQQASSLASTIMGTIREAVARSAREQAVLVDSHLDGQLGLSDQVIATQAEAFGISEQELRRRIDEEPVEVAPTFEPGDSIMTSEAPKAPRRRPAPAEQDDDYPEDGGSVFQKGGW